MSSLAFVVFVLAFAGLVLIHEFGHFIVARLLKIEIEEFGIGFPPRLLRLWRGKGSIVIGNQRLEIPGNFELPFERQAAINRTVNAIAETVDDRLVLRAIEMVQDEELSGQPKPIYVDKNGRSLPERSLQQEPIRTVLQPGDIKLGGRVTDINLGMELTLNMLPIGGFVRPKGENDPSIAGGLAAASPWSRLAVLLAGPTMNLIAGVLVYSIIFNMTGMPDTKTVEILDVSSNSPAQQAGIKTGDVVLRISGQPVNDIEQLRTFIRNHLDQPLEIVVSRGGQETTLTVTPSSARPAEQGAVGVLLSNPIVKPRTWFDTIPMSLMVTGSYIHGILTLPGQILAGIAPAGDARLIGLRGIYDFFSQAVTRDTQSRQQPSTSGQSPTLPGEGPTNYTLALIATLTISLGIFNLLPLPALDGGRILFVLPELIFRRRVSPQLETAVHGIGLLLLLLLMVYINVMDFVNPINVMLP
jgi:regulator of sigma E protease